MTANTRIPLRLFSLFLSLLLLLLSALPAASVRAEDGGYTVTISAENSWQEEGESCCQYAIRIDNHSEGTLDGWQLTLDKGIAPLIRSNWNCDAFLSGPALVLNAMDYNGSIPAGGSLTGIGLILRYPGEDVFSGTYRYDPSTGSLTEEAGISEEENREETEDATVPRPDDRPEETAVPETAEEPPVSSSIADDTAPGAAGQAPAAAVTGMYGDLAVNGVNLVNSAGSPVQLRGVSTHGLAWFPQYVNAEAFRSLRDTWGVNLIRLAMYTAEYGGYCAGGDKANLEALIDTGVKACADLGLYCIIDWHILSDGNPNTHLAEAKDFFSRMSAKYAGYHNVLYEICNEPNGGTSWPTIKAYADQVIPVIRANAPEAIILVGTPTWSQDVEQVAAAPVENPHNVMYTLHFYAATHGAFLRDKLNAARAAGTPVFISEFSTCDASGNGSVNYDEAGQWKTLIRQENLSFAGWSLCNKAESSSILKSSCGKTSGWTEDDLSDTGKWLMDLISGDSSASGDNGSQVPKPIRTGWVYQDSAWYYYRDSGIALTGWLQDNGKTYYLGQDGKMQTGWQKIDGDWYFFYNGGSMAKGWVHQNSTWYYTDQNGRMQTGWLIENNKTYYLRKGGAMAIGWLYESGNWYYFLRSGAMAAGWFKDGDRWYFASADGILQYGWITDMGKTYFLTDSGAMKTGWLLYQEDWYCFTPSGSMCRKTWYQDYYFDETGKMLTDTWIGRYYVGPDGKWVPNAGNP